MKQYICAIIAAMVISMPAQAEFQWGVNGHPNVQEGYRQVPISVQLDMVKASGAKWYRTDWPEEVIRKDPASFDRLVNEARRRGLRILPALIPTTGCRSEASPEQIRKASAEYGKWIGARYKGRITHWELSNELDAFAMIRKGEKDRNGAIWQWNDADMDKPEQFEESRYAKVRAELAGLGDGVKSADPKAVTIIDSSGWLHYGFFQRLVIEDKVPFDILGWHWYSEMGDMIRVRGSFNVLEKLKSFGKPIWITEINRRGGSMDGEMEQSTWLTGVARRMRSYPGVSAFFVYELFDEPYFGADNPESHYGMVEMVKGADKMWAAGRRKAAFASMRALMNETTPKPK